MNNLKETPVALELSGVLGALCQEQRPNTFLVIPQGCTYTLFQYCLGLKVVDN